MKTIETILEMRDLRNPVVRLAANLEYTGGWLSLQYNRMLRPYGLSYPQYSTLQLLQSGDLTSVKGLQSAMTIPGSNMSRLIEKLRQKGLVERSEVSEDRRRSEVSLTNAGRNLLSLLAAEEDRSLRWKSNLTRQEAETLSYLLDKLRS